MEKAVLEKIKNELSKKRFKGLSRYFLGDQSGAAMFLFNYSRCFNDSESYQDASNCLDTLIKHYNNHFEDVPSLSKFEWMIKYLSGNNFIKIEQYEDSDLIMLENYLFKSQNLFLEEGVFDFLHGGLGIGLYFVNRNREKEVIKLVNDIENISENDKNGIKWKAITKIDTMEKIYNLSLSHGMSSIIVMLCKIYNSKFENLLWKVLRKCNQVVWHGTDNGYESELGLLEGIAGIGLALLSYYYEVDMSWDECLLLS